MVWRPPDQPFSSLYARYRIWRDHERCEAARLAYVKRTGRPERAGAQRIDDLEPTSDDDLVVTIWWLASGSTRIEHSGGRRDGAVGVRRGSSWWTSEPRSAVRSNDQGSGDPPSWLLHGSEPFLDGAHSLDGLRLEREGTGTRAGRPVIVAYCRRPPRDPAGPPWEPRLRPFGACAESYRFEFDADYGIVAAAHAYFEREAFQIMEALAIGFNGLIDTSTFEIPTTSQPR